MKFQLKEDQTRAIALIAIIIMLSSMGSLSQTALNAMYVQVCQDLSLSMAVAQWATTTYMLVLGVSVPVVPFLMRRFPLKRVCLGALSLMLLGALLSATSWNFAMLVAGRVLQAISAGLAIPMMMTVVMTRFPPNRRGTIMGIAGIAMGFCPNVGPTVGGFMVDAWGWRSFFFLLVVVAVVLLVLALILIKAEPQQGESQPFDFLSFLLSTVAFGSLLLGFTNASSVDLADPWVWLPILLGAVFLVFFLKRQRRVDAPLIHLDIFDSWCYRRGFVSLGLLYGSFMGITLLVPLYVQNLCGGTASDSGMVLLLGACVALVGNPLAGSLCDRIGHRPVVLVTSVCLVLGSASMAMLDATTPLWVAAVMQGVRQMGVSGLISPLNSWYMRDLPPELMADGSSFGTTIPQLMAALCTAVMVFLVTSAPTWFGDVTIGYHLAFGFSGLLAFGCAVNNILSVR